MPKNKIAIDRYLVKGRPRVGQATNDSPGDDDDYDRRLKAMQKQLLLIQQAYLGTDERAVIVLEGWDTAGKGGIVRRLGWALDPRSFRVHPISAPTEHEKQEHYLQRFWERMPLAGQIVVFDRSWYGRVLVERVEGYASEKEWKRAYSEINDLESCLVADGFRIVKIFLDISQDVQVERFKERLTDPYKRWKLTYEDFRNHTRWRDYKVATRDMMEKTSTEHAPWYLVPSNDQHFGRLVAFEIFLDRLGKGINLSPRPLDKELEAEAERLFGVKMVHKILDE